MSLIETAVSLKKKNTNSRELAERSLALIFEKPSLRTRISFDIAMWQLGGHVVYLSPEEVGIGSRESVRDVAHVLSRYVSGIAARTFSHRTLTEMAEYATIPVINALSDEEHPCQALADLMTIYEVKGGIKGVTLAYVGDGNNVANSLLFMAARVGMNFRIASPAGYGIHEGILARAEEMAGASGSKIICTSDPQEVTESADVIYTDVWTSMGQEAERDERRKVFAGFQVTPSMLSKANPDSIFMHPLPAHHGEEVADGVLYSPNSEVFRQAENRLHVQKALLLVLLSSRG
ncbi:MAG: ornithine carbamoyltransferase [Dehalococcoidia bacterium]|nr:ornithine carbamoyltransferase [Dehalococcoidia bacterium]